MRLANACTRIPREDRLRLEQQARARGITLYAHLRSLLSAASAAQPAVPEDTAGDADAEPGHNDS